MQVAALRQEQAALRSKNRRLQAGSGFQEAFDAYDAEVGGAASMGWLLCGLMSRRRGVGDQCKHVVEFGVQVAALRQEQAALRGKNRRLQAASGFQEAFDAYDAEVGGAAGKGGCCVGSLEGDGVLMMNARNLDACGRKGVPLRRKQSSLHDKSRRLQADSGLGKAFDAYDAEVIVLFSLKSAVVALLCWSDKNGLSVATSSVS